MALNFYIVSGMSGAGKSQTLKIFEDFGFFCVDNMPIAMMDGFIKMCLKNVPQYEKTAISIDVRAGSGLYKLKDILKTLKKRQISVKTLFLNADDSTLIKRYSETRRKHPIGKPIAQSIEIERKILADILKESDEAVNTSNMTMGELKNVIAELSGVSMEKNRINVSIISFGYKYGLPLDADIVYDVRFLSNPNYIDCLKSKTGKDTAVKKYILKNGGFKNFFNLFSKLIENSLPKFIAEGKSYLTIALGCTGGKHRSVFTAEQLAEFLVKNKYKVNINHRDILR